MSDASRRYCAWDTNILDKSSLGRIEPLPLGSGEVHVWQADLERLSIPETCAAVLSTDECQRADRFRFPRDQRRYRHCRVLLRMLLAGYLQIEPAQISFGYWAHGKPSLAASCGSSDIRFNLSHSGEKAVFGFVRSREIGVDVEQIRHDFEVQAIAERFFSAAEGKALSQIPAHDRHQAFFNCWTRKEAFVKAKGGGLLLPLDQFDVSLVPGEPAELLRTRPDPEERNRWSLWNLEVGPEYAGALVIEGAGLKILNFEVA
jgi:4'-phosphopantetheinyl transferase